MSRFCGTPAPQWTRSISWLRVESGTEPRTGDSAPVELVAHISGRPVRREQVLDWESKRASRVAAKLCGAALPADLASARRSLAARKLELGHDAIEALLARELAWAERVGRVGAAASRGRRRLSTIELSSSEGAAEHLPQWYYERITENDEAPLLEACPDHYLSRTRSDGRQEVIETTGGAPLAVRMFFDETDLSTLTSAPDPSFPIEWTGIARNSRGAPIGGIRHLFRNENGGGFRMRLTVEFPWFTPPHLINAHRWHLACEFSNWVEAADAAPEFVRT